MGGGKRNNNNNNRSAWHRLCAYVSHCYLLYELNTSVYMLGGTAKTLLHLTLLTLLALLLYSSLTYLPPYLSTMAAFFFPAPPTTHAPPHHSASSQTADFS